MGKHLSIAEKLNAENEFYENKIKMKWLREQLNALKYRNARLEYYLVNRKNSKYNGLYGINGTCYKMFGRKFSELTVEEKRKYHSITKEQRKIKALEDK